MIANVDIVAEVKTNDILAKSPGDEDLVFNLSHTEMMEGW